MKLTDAKIDEKLEIVQISKNNHEQRLLALGMVEGCSVCPIQKNGDTVLLDVNGCRYALSKEITDCVFVKRL